MRGMGRQRQTRTVKVGLAALMLVAGCDLDGGTRDLGLRAQLPGGLRVTMADAYATVFSIARPDRVHVGLSICTGTLIAPTVLLTAAHCVTIEPGDDTYEVQDADEFFISNGPSVDSLGDDLTVVDIDVHPDYVPGTAFFDLAMVHLEQDATVHTGGRWMRVARSFDEAHIGLPRGADIVGYGGNAYPDPYYDPADAPEVGARLHVPHELDKLGCDADDPACEYRNLALSYDNSPNAGFCGASGGGPVLVFRDAEGKAAPMPWQYLEDDSPTPRGGTMVLAAVVSRVVDADACVGEGIATRIDPALDFVRDVLPEDPPPRRSLPLPWD